MSLPSFRHHHCLFHHCNIMFLAHIYSSLANHQIELLSSVMVILLLLPSRMPFINSAASILILKSKGSFTRRLFLGKSHIFDSYDFGQRGLTPQAKKISLATLPPRVEVPCARSSGPIRRRKSRSLLGTKLKPKSIRPFIDPSDQK